MALRSQLDILAW